MRDVLRRSLGRSLQGMPELDRLQAAWPVACGKVMAARGAVVGFEGGTVQIRVNDPAWMDQMISMRSILQRDLARIAGIPLAAIHFGKTDAKGSTE